MKALRIALMLMCVWQLSACDGGSDSQPDEGSTESPKPIDSELAKLSAEVLVQVHQDLRNEEARAHQSPSAWRRVSGWKLFHILQQRIQVPGHILESPRNARLFFTLHQSLHNSSGTVKNYIDSKEIIAELIREYFN